MTSNKRPAGASLNEIATAGGTSHTQVRRTLVSAFPTLVGKGRNTIPREVGELLAATFRGGIMGRPTGRMLGEDPAAVLAAAEALAELARRALAERQEDGPLAA
ncbi:hypothetical protein [Streptomyces sp. NPDC059278]|uniref:hypothetical protein n=1 Tax=unclassified Streptomyces TaxID=2593676 RepID=UPI0036CDAB40